MNINIIRAETGNFFNNKSKKIEDIGESIGSERFKDNWKKMLFPSEKKLRIIEPPSYDYELGIMRIKTAIIEWYTLQRFRQLMPNEIQDEEFALKDKESYIKNCIALTGNALIETNDNKFVFHIKKGGAKEGTIHTFGGYISPDDESVESGVLRELSENNELGLTKDICNINIMDSFGTEDNFPSILWGFGTGAIYVHLKLSISSDELRDHFRSRNREESLKKDLIILRYQDMKKEHDWHPQTRKVLGQIKKRIR